MGKETKNKEHNTFQIVNPPNPFYIVGIGTSAGGLEALQEFFDNCPDNTGMAFVIVQHLSPNYKSLMPELLARNTSMKIDEAQDGEEVEPNRVYLIPSKKNITIQDGRLQLVKRPVSSQMNFPIDIFLYSLASDQKEKSIAVILSGTGSDGTRGGKAIKEAGGTVFVQSPDSAKFDGMPRSAILNDIADYILQPAEMPNELIDFVSHPQFSDVITAADLGRNVNAMDRILKIIKAHTGFDFFSYKKPTLLRRTAKRMNITKSESIENYIEQLYGNPDEKFTLVQEFLIGVTKFFRDEEAYKILETQIIPNIVEEKKLKTEPIKIWIVACSTGEEAYSIAILFEEFLRKIKSNYSYKIFATDIDGRAIDIAAKGIYPDTIALDISSERLNSYFIQKDNGYQILPKIRKNIIFSKHDVLNNPPFSKMDLVSCRNMLIYLEKNTQSKVLSSLHFSLKQGGYLFMGSAENIDLLHDSFEEVNQKWKFYRNINPSKLISTDRKEPWRIERNGEPIYAPNQVKTYRGKIEREVNQLLAEEFKSVVVCIDENYDIQYAVGKLKKYARMPDEGFSTNLMDVLPDEINLPVSTGIREVSKGNDSLITKKIDYLNDGVLSKIKLNIKLLGRRKIRNKLFLITFIEEMERPLTEEEQKKVIPNLQNQMEEVLGLREALNDTKENLQSTIEELETSNEEMQATNEELLASNEELQSTNEELQSLNEELHTVNQELQEKNLELSELNTDMENLMSNTSIGMIFLDKAFKIRKFTPAVKEHFDFQDTDLGRPLENFSGSLNGYELVRYGEQVLSTLEPFQKEIQNKKDEWFELQIIPYKTQEGIVQGVVINFININDIKRAMIEKSQLNDYLGHLMTTIPSIIYKFDAQARKTLYSSTQLESMLGYTPEELVNMEEDVIDRTIFKEDIEKLIKIRNGDAQLKDDEIRQYDIRMYHKITREPKTILCTEKVYKRDEAGNVKTLLGVIQEKLENNVDMEKQLFYDYINHMKNSIPASLYIYELTSGKPSFTTTRSLELGDYSGQQLFDFGNDFLENVIYKEDLEKVLENRKKLLSLKDGIFFRSQYRIKENRTNHPIPVEVTEMVHERDEAGNVVSILGLVKLRKEE
ncbi:MAG: chemotaxis protein CheB [Bacteroidota bacterium]